ncbi:MAG: hypothetical protein JWP89_4528 [Schlesneria sp.]|nr:hypothetical protein [Schlesneria sp.]
MNNRSLRLACWAVRISLAMSFLSAVADRSGFWGPPDSAGVAWGSIARYEGYVAKLNWFLPLHLVSPLGWMATITEVLIAIGLIVGIKLRWVALAAALLLTTFATTMAVAFGLKPPLDYSVFSAAAAAFLLSAVTSNEGPDRNAATE